jgi:hypothetical protein
MPRQTNNEFLLNFNDVTPNIVLEDITPTPITIHPEVIPENLGIVWEDVTNETIRQSDEEYDDFNEYEERYHYVEINDNDVTTKDVKLKLLRPLIHQDHIFDLNTIRGNSMTLNHLKVGLKDQFNQANKPSQSMFCYNDNREFSPLTKLHNYYKHSLCKKYIN